MVERFFRDLTTRRLRDGIFHSVAELEAAIASYIASHNVAPKTLYLDLLSLRYPRQSGPCSRLPK